MLRVSIHAGPLAKISRSNRLDWLDIGYQRLAPAADYKVVLFKIGEGALPPVGLPSYPRWSASLWDLVARSIARSLFPAAAPNPALQEAVPAAVHVEKKRAFAEVISAVIQHMPNAGPAVHRLGSLQIDEHKTARCRYRAHIEEDLRPDRKTDEFYFAPGFLQPSELVLRATLFWLSGSIDVMPPRPLLQAPKGKMIDGKECLLIHQLNDPAKTGLVRWLHHQRRPRSRTPRCPKAASSTRHFTSFSRKPYERGDGTG
jgi:hypothetical protein